MCGISGTVNWGNATHLHRMNLLQEHRGPDDAGIHLAQTAAGQSVGFASRRLAILDRSPYGRMPMSTDDGACTMVYNGEVYNFRELRRELERAGANFRSRTDTEVVLLLYHLEGPKFVRRLRGMFALAIWDRRSDHLLLARDHFGIKPLYYTQRGDRFAFASEAKCFTALPGFDATLSLAALQQYLTFLWVPDPHTMFHGVMKVPAGHIGILHQGTFALHPYWSPTYPRAAAPLPCPEADLTDEVRHRFSEVVRSQMISDVPLGAFLSSGIDSSAIVAATARHSAQPIHTYTVSFSQRYRHSAVPLDDTSVAQRTAASLGCRHRNIVISPDVETLLPKLVWHLDEPVADPAVIAAFLVNDAARSEATVMLSGVGGDELFGGYRKYQAHYLAQRYQILPRVARRHLIEPLLASLPPFRGRPGARLVRFMKKMARSGSLPPRERFLADGTYVSSDLIGWLCNEWLLEAFRPHDPLEQHTRYFREIEHADFLNQMLYVDQKSFMVSLNLTYNDKMSMANSMEVRVPFLDWEFADWIAHNVSPTMKVKGRTTKYLLREAMRPWLSHEVLAQKKAGFGAPLELWLDHDLRSMTMDLLGERQIRQRGLFRAATVNRLLDEHFSRRADWSLQIWQLLMLELWQQTFLD